MGLLRKTLSVSFTLGTYKYLSKSEKLERDFKRRATAAQKTNERTNVLLSIQNDLIAEQTALIESRTAPATKRPEPIPVKKISPPVRAQKAPVAPKAVAPPREPKVAAPKVAKVIVEKALIDKAERTVISTQSASRFRLMSELEITGPECNYVMKMLEKRKVLSKEDKDGDRVVIQRLPRGLR